MPPNRLIEGSLQLFRRLRIPALFCALTVLVCELISRPFANMGICDDGPYILMARTLATTGHIVYNGWASPMLTCQLYLGAAFDGSRLNKLYREDLDHAGIVAALDPLFAAYAGRRQTGERFGAFAIRAGFVAPTRNGPDFHANTGPQRAA